MNYFITDPNGYYIIDIHKSDYNKDHITYYQGCKKEANKLSLYEATKNCLLFKLNKYHPKGKFQIIIDK